MCPRTSLVHGIKRAAFRMILLLVLSAAAESLIASQTAATKAKIDPMTVPEITVQNEDYAVARSHFKTKLLQKGPSPHQDCASAKPPAEVSEIQFTSGSLLLKAWINRAAGNNNRKSPTVLFLHGGFCFDSSDWEATQPFRSAGFIVMIPTLRGEEGQPGYFSMFYDEVDDVVSAAEFLRSQPYVDPGQLYIAGHSVGGTLTLLSAMTYPHFRAAASFSGSPDAVGYTRHTVAIGGEVPFNFTDPMELQLRSARVYAASFKCPVRIYYGADETHFALSSKPTAELAQAHHLNVQAIAVDGGHNSALPAEMEQAIQFFGQTSNK
jgi:dipeptidyl aminopeptidase/acylaminoacyl peptidase